MNHIKIFSAAVVAVLLCSGMKAAQSELPCGVTLFFDYKVAETNSVKTGRPGLLSGSTNWYRTDEEIITQSFNLPSIHWGSFNSTYRANYPSVHHFGEAGALRHQGSKDRPPSPMYLMKSCLHRRIAPHPARTAYGATT